MRTFREWYKLNRANFITALGLVFTSLLLVEVIKRPENLGTITIYYLLSGLSDFLDGKVARGFNIESNLGAVIDPIRDKLLFCPSLAILVYQYSPRFHFSIFALIVAVAILEITTLVMACLGLYLHVKGTIRVDISSSKSGKNKTFCAFITGLLIIFYVTANSKLAEVASLSLIYLGFILMIYWGIKSIGEYGKKKLENKAQ
jgi:phosphatidylglycerophosphate synthase